MSDSPVGFDCAWCKPAMNGVVATSAAEVFKNERLERSSRVMIKQPVGSIGKFLVLYQCEKVSNQLQNRWLEQTGLRLRMHYHDFSYCCCWCCAGIRTGFSVTKSLLQVEHALPETDVPEGSRLMKYPGGTAHLTFYQPLLSLHSGPLVLRYHLIFRSCSWQSGMW